MHGWEEEPTKTASRPRYGAHARAEDGRSGHTIGSSLHDDRGGCRRALGLGLGCARAPGSGCG